MTEYRNSRNQLHREDGPAITWDDGSPCYRSKWNYQAWWINGKSLSKDLFLKLTGPKEDLPLYLGLRHDKYIAERLKSSITTGINPVACD